MNGRYRRLIWATLSLGMATAVVGPQALGADKVKVEKVLQGVDLARSAGALFDAQRPTSLLQKQRWSYGVAHDSHLDAQLDRILQEIRRVAGPDAPDARIHVTPSPILEAYASDEGDIFIAVGLLQQLETCDALASVIGHEYAHVLLRHRGTPLLDSAKSVVGGLSALYLDYAYGRDPTRAVQGKTSFVRGSVAREAFMQAVQVGIAPARKKEQEAEADRTGIDLMVKAGYNPVGMVGMLVVLSRFDQVNAEKRLATPAQLPQKGTVDATVADYLANTKPARKLDQRLDRGTAVDLLNASVGALRQALNAGSTGHSPTDQRIRDARNYISTAYRRAPRPDERPLPWEGDAVVGQFFDDMDAINKALGDSAQQRTQKVDLARLMSMNNRPAAQTPLARYVVLRLYEKQAGRKQALPLLMQELSRDDSLFASHVLVLDDIAPQVDAKQAIQMLEASRTSFGDPPELLPYSIRLYKRAGENQRAQRYQTQCVGSGNDALKQQCLSAL